MEDTNIEVKNALPILNVIAFVAVIVISILAGSKILNHTAVVEAYSLHHTLFTPAEYTQILWWIIFVALGIFVIYQVLPAYRSNALNQRVGWLFVLHALGLLLFPFFWCYKLLWPSVIAMLWVLFTAMAIYIRLGIDYSKRGQSRTIEAPAGTASEGILITYQDYWLVQVPFSLLLGWLLPMAMLTVWVAASYDPASESEIWTYEGWSSLLLTALTFAAATFVLSRSDFIAAAAIAWFQFGVAAAHHSDPVVETAALVNGFIVLGGTLLTTFCVGWRHATMHRERLGYAEIKG